MYIILSFCESIVLKRLQLSLSFVRIFLLWILSNLILTYEVKHQRTRFNFLLWILWPHIPVIKACKEPQLTVQIHQRNYKRWKLWEWYIGRYVDRFPTHYLYFLSLFNWCNLLLGGWFATWHLFYTINCKIKSFDWYHFEPNFSPKSVYM